MYILYKKKPVVSTDFGQYFTKKEPAEAGSCYFG
jgi:hypothetical protein